MRSYKTANVLEQTPGGFDCFCTSGWNSSERVRGERAPVQTSLREHFVGANLGAVAVASQVREQSRSSIDDTLESRTYAAVKAYHGQISRCFARFRSVRAHITRAVCVR